MSKKVHLKYILENCFIKVLCINLWISIDLIDNKDLHKTQI